MVVLPQLPWGVRLRTVCQRGPSVPKSAQVTSAACEVPVVLSALLDPALGRRGRSSSVSGRALVGTVLSCVPGHSPGAAPASVSSLCWAPRAPSPNPALPTVPDPHTAPALGSLCSSAAGPQPPDPAPSQGSPFPAPKVAATQVNHSVLPTRNPTCPTVTPVSVPGQFGAVNWGRDLVCRGVGNWFCSCLTTMSSAAHPQPQSSQCWAQASLGLGGCRAPTYTPGLH